MVKSEIPFGDAIRLHPKFELINYGQSFRGTPHKQMENIIEYNKNKYSNSIVVAYEPLISNERNRLPDLSFTYKDLRLMVDLKNSYSENYVAEQISGMFNFNANEYWYVITNVNKSLTKVLDNIYKPHPKVRVYKTIEPKIFLNDVLMYFKLKI